MQNCSVSIANVLEILQYCIEQSIYLIRLTQCYHVCSSSVISLFISSGTVYIIILEICLDRYTVISTGSLHWRHNDHGSVSNHQPHGCLLNRLFRHTSKKTSKLRVTGLFAGNSPGLVNSPHKGPVTRKMFPFDDVIMDWPVTRRLDCSQNVRTVGNDDLALQ